MTEISSLEKQIYVHLQKFEEIKETNKKLKATVDQLRKENEALLLKQEELESKLKEKFLDLEDINAINSLDPGEKEKIKSKINDFISRIDYHLGS
ncbi:MAG: hypothetical protein K9J16_05480 [Melioribacteraceae bacterium]|nr:hypothetical protein [Melioribacteraceae bacterium]MCF8354386.1 hypothetical protein [Melioribacteraceae bacterium]MCF8396214.1 hypothetical protein [Melioribacteraceae bacterium]MCF8417240.1 hypothetical protein [Melioribacteraceae bacterium]